MAPERRWPRRLAIGAVVLLVLVCVGLAYSPLATVPAERLASEQGLRCYTNLGRIAVALLAYADRHGGGQRFPATLDALFEQGLLTHEAVLRCPAAAPIRSTAGGRATSYHYRGGLALTAPGQMLLLHEAGTPHPGMGHDGRALAFGNGVEADLEVWRYPDGAEAVASGQRSLRGLETARSPEPLLQALKGARDAERRVRAAWRLWRLKAGATGPLTAALADPADEVALYAGLALLDRGQTSGVPRILRALGRRTVRGQHAIDGPRRRWVLERLSSDPRTRPVPIFAYDGVDAQARALAAWRARWTP